MPKDATKNIDRYKIRGGQLNEFEYTQGQKALAEKQPKGGAKLIPGTPPEEAGAGLRLAVKATSKATKTTKSTQKAKKSSTKATKKATKNSSTKSASAGKPAARKTSKKK